MELSTMFTALVLAIGVFHLVSKISTFIHRYLAASKSSSATVSRKATKRDDWYMFFHCSDLTGKDAGKAQNTHDSSFSQSDKTKITTTVDRRRQIRPVAR